MKRFRRWTHHPHRNAVGVAAPAKVRRRTIVFISHDLDEAMRIGDRIAIMKDGQVVQVGTPDDILQPANDYVRSFIRGVDAAAVFKASDIARKPLTVVAEHADRGSRAALKMLGPRPRIRVCGQPAQQFWGGVGGPLRSALAGHQGHWAGTCLPASGAAHRGGRTRQRAVWPASPVRPSPCPWCSRTAALVAPSARPPLLKFLDRDTPPVPPSQPALASAQMH